MRDKRDRDKFPTSHSLSGSLITSTWQACMLMLLATRKTGTQRLNSFRPADSSVSLRGNTTAVLFSVSLLRPRHRIQNPPRLFIQPGQEACFWTCISGGKVAVGLTFLPESVQRSSASCRAEVVFWYPTQLPKENCLKGQIPEPTPATESRSWCRLSLSSSATTADVDTHGLLLRPDAPPAFRHSPKSLFPQLAARGTGSLHFL